MSEQAADKDARILDVLERLVYLLERGDYVPFGLITEARGVLDASREERR
jgi:hypothetical protein